jgi:hypothetical protein
MKKLLPDERTGGKRFDKVGFLSATRRLSGRIISVQNEVPLAGAGVGAGAAGGPGAGAAGAAGAGTGAWVGGGIAYNSGPSCPALHPVRLHLLHLPTGPRTAG